MARTNQQEKFRQNIRQMNIWDFMEKSEEMIREEFQAAVSRDDISAAEDALWELLCVCEGTSFSTVKNLSFTYTIKGNEIYFSRKEKSVTRASVNIAFETAVSLQKSGAVITGPKMLNCFGASYVYPVFIQLGVIPSPVLCSDKS